MQFGRDMQGPTKWTDALFGAIGFCVCVLLSCFFFVLFESKNEDLDSGVSGGKSKKQTKKENKYKAPWRNGVFFVVSFLLYTSDYFSYFRFSNECIPE